jgi:hypothetical protein
VAIGPGLSTFTRIFLPFSSLSQVRANERNAALLAAYTPKPLDGRIPDRSSGHVSLRIRSPF